MKKAIFMLLLASLTMEAVAQTENPRGIYKMMTLIGKQGEILAPFDQYKICTDSFTLMLNVHNSTFIISNTDNQVLNYTGEQPKEENDKSTLIYDSNADHFTLKWWSENRGHLYFPDNDWCIEKYEAGQYSENGRIALDALTGKAEVDPRNPLTGTWRIIGYVDELSDVKKELARLHNQYPTSKYYNSFVVLSPKNGVLIAGMRGGSISKIEYEGKKAYKAGNTTHHVKWLSKDRIAVEEHIDYRTDWQILERVADNQSPLSLITSKITGRKE
jgi:hypothetical protein